MCKQKCLTSISDWTTAAVVVKSIGTTASVLTRIQVTLIYFSLTITAFIAGSTLASIPNHRKQ